MYDKDSMTAVEALTAAQRLAFAPLAFHATAVMRDRGLLAAVSKGVDGCTLEEVATQTSMSVYAVRVLLEAGLGLHLVWRKNERYHLGKVGHFLLHDEMTRVNFDFTRDVCYRAAEHLDESLQTARPAGLKTLGPWATLYQGLSVMPEPALSSWHAFDHFHSDQAFPAVSQRLLLSPPERVLDIGCNTGKWAAVCLNQMPSVHVGLVDLSPQLARAKERLDAAGLGGRAQFFPLNVLDPNTIFPKGHDLIWMSQFLDCFSEVEIVDILNKVRDAMPENGRLWILELFWDRQRIQAAAFSLQQTSLYFTCVANGNSQMYDSNLFLTLVARAGLEVERISDGHGGCHTLLECRSAT